MTDNEKPGIPKWVEKYMDDRIDGAPSDCPLESIEAVLAFSAQDFSIDKNWAWLWGVIHGWDEKAMKEMVQKHKWSEEMVARLNLLHLKWKELKRHNLCKRIEQFLEDRSPVRDGA